MRIKFVYHLFNLFEAQGNKENVITLTRKLLRLSRGSDRDLKMEKEKNKEKEKEKEK